MIARDRVRRRDIFEDALAGMGDGGCFAVQGRGFDDGAAKGLADGLMAETYAQHRDFCGFVGFDQVEANAGFVGGCRAGGNDNAGRFLIDDVLRGLFIVADDCRGRAEIAAILGDVVREAVVIVYQNNHGISIHVIPSEVEGSHNRWRFLHSLWSVEMTVCVVLWCKGG